MPNSFKTFINNGLVPDQFNSITTVKGYTLQRGWHRVNERPIIKIEIPEALPDKPAKALKAEKKQLKLIES